MAKDSGNTQTCSDIYMNILYQINRADTTPHGLVWFYAIVGYIDTNNHKFINIVGTPSNTMKPLCKYLNQNYFAPPLGSMTNVSNNNGIGDFFQSPVNIFELQLKGIFDNNGQGNIYFSDFIDEFGEDASFIVKFKSRLHVISQNVYVEQYWPACLKLNKSQLLGFTGVYDNITTDPSQNVIFESSYQGYVWEPYFDSNIL